MTTPTPPTATVEGTLMSPLISIDPSITCTGVARFESDGLNSCFRVRPKQTRKGKTIPAHERIEELICELGGEIRGIIHGYQRVNFVVEITSGKTSGRHGGGGAGLATYGMAVGQVVRFLKEEYGRDQVHEVYENEWTRGKGQKEHRRWHCRHAYPLYAEHAYEIDKGGDIADAILLGDWWINNQRIRETA